MKKINLILIILLLIPAFSFARIPRGYRGMKWGTHINTVRSKYKGLKLGNKKIYNLRNYVSYTQTYPTKSIRTRTFYFFKNRLCAVKIVYNYGPTQIKKLKQISSDLQKDFGNVRVKSYKSQRYGRVVQHIVWRGNGTKVTFFLAQQGTKVVVTGQVNYLYFESIAYKRRIAKAVKDYKSGKKARRRRSLREDRGY